MERTANIRNEEGGLAREFKTRDPRPEGRRIRDVRATEAIEFHCFGCRRRGLRNPIEIVRLGFPPEMYVSLLGPYGRCKRCGARCRWTRSSIAQVR